MGKLKEVFSEITKDFNWKVFVSAMCITIAVLSFVGGIILAAKTGCLLWLLLWILSGISLGFVAGANE